MSATNLPSTYVHAQQRLADRLDGFESRPSQDALAMGIEATLRGNRSEVLVASAPTGTGKSIAALIPAVLVGSVERQRDEVPVRVATKRTVYATATKALQNQIIEKDGPFLQEHLGVEFEIAALYGRGNYACQVAASASAGQGSEFARQVMARLDDPEAEWDGLRETWGENVEPADWKQVSIDADQCQRKNCPFYDVCPFYIAKEIANKANVVVVNHALLALDLRMMELTGEPGAVVGPYDHLVIDEAHELADWITDAMTHEMNTWTFRTLQRETVANASQLGDEVADDVRNGMVELTSRAGVMFEQMKATAADNGRLRQVDDLTSIDDVLRIVKELRDILDDHPVMSADDRKLRAAWQRRSTRLVNIAVALESVKSGDTNRVAFVEQMTRRDGSVITTLKSVPLSVADPIGQMLFRSPTVMMSATILVDGKADYLDHQTGMTKHDVSFDVIDVPTPFDYDANSVLYVPRHLPIPSGRSRDDWRVQMQNLMARATIAANGGALLLFTSMSEMRQAFTALGSRLRDAGIEARMQGEGYTNRELAAWKVEHPDSVVFATRSFFTGISVEGEALRLVIIDKLPFPVPTDPVFEARAEAIDRSGGSSFMQLSVPMMTLPLQQAAGRLIRTQSDRGVIAIMDPRIVNKPYGRKISRSLPSPLSSDMTDVFAFFGAEMPPAQPAPIMEIGTLGA
jgi:ATP-dependent DNA helicase DinG